MALCVLRVSIRSIKVYIRNSNAFITPLRPVALDGVLISAVDGEEPKLEADTGSFSDEEVSRGAGRFAFLFSDSLTLDRDSRADEEATSLFPFTVTREEAFANKLFFFSCQSSNGDKYGEEMKKEQQVVCQLSVKDPTTGMKRIK